ncbi:MAG: class I SAM-dependent methyltransferase [Gemmatimonadales bacterium]
MIPRTHFDGAYYKRYYADPETAVVDPEMGKNEVAFVLAFCRHIGLEIKRFTDVGAGTGWWAKEFTRRYPKCNRIETLDASEAACEAFGHKLSEIQSLSGPESDLVICRDVLRYLSDTNAENAIRRLGKKCRGVLYLHVITSDDEIDEEASDMAGFFRSTAWYLKRLRAAGFTDCGMGLFVSGKFKDFSPFTIEARTSR